MGDLGRLMGELGVVPGRKTQFFLAVLNIFVLFFLITIVLLLILLVFVLNKIFSQNIIFNFNCLVSLIITFIII